MCMGTSLTILWRQGKRKWFCVDMTAYQKHRMPNRRFSVYLLIQIAVVTEKTTLSCRPPTATFTAWGPQLKNVTLKWIKSYRNLVPVSDSLQTGILFSGGISTRYTTSSPLWCLAKSLIPYSLKNKTCKKYYNSQFRVSTAGSDLRFFRLLRCVYWFFRIHFNPPSIFSHVLQVDFIPVKLHEKTTRQWPYRRLTGPNGDAEKLRSCKRKLSQLSTKYPKHYSTCVTRKFLGGGRGWGNSAKRNICGANWNTPSSHAAILSPVRLLNLIQPQCRFKHACILTNVFDTCP